MRKRIFPLVTLFLIFAFTSCNKATPAGFWRNYKKSLLVNDISEQGLYGGHRAVYWKSGITNSFTSADVLDFARKNGWKLVDSSNFDRKATK